MHFGRRALLDNATLTGVERILGRIKVKNTYNIEGDILCLENLLQTLLFYDELFFVDDYKEEFKRTRAAFFGFLKPLEITEDAYDAYQRQARQIVHGLAPTVQNGTVKTSELKQLLDLIQMNLVFTWDMHSSEFYLTLKLLAEKSEAEFDKYGALSAMITSGFTEQSRVETEPIAQELRVLDKHGRPIPNGVGENIRLKDDEIKTSKGVSDNTTRFLSGLSWLCFRTVLYRLIGEAYMCDLILHPIRHSCLVTVLPAIYQDDTSRYRPIVDAMTGGARQTINRIGSTTTSTIVKHPLPIFSAWLAKKGVKPSRFIEEAQTLRDDKLFRDARQQFSELEAKHTIHGEPRFKTEANILVKDIFRTFEQLETKYGISTPQGIPTAPIIWTYNLYGAAHGAPPAPNLGAKIPLPKSLNNLVVDRIPRKGFSAVFKSVIDDLAQIARLGSIMDKLKQEVRWMPDSGKSKLTHLEPRFQGSRSNWTAPME